MATTPAQQLAEFLKARRARVDPADLGIEPGARRKVAGLRREELAMLAGVSTDYYQRIEQGRDVHPSDDVLDALARALLLDRDETRHLFTLAHTARRPARVRRRRPELVPESTRRLLATAGSPALVLGRHLDALAWNPLAGSLFGGIDDQPVRERNLALAVFLHPTAREMCADWEESAIEYIGMLRVAVAADPDHPRAQQLVGELSVHSPDFRRLWARHDVRQKVRGTKAFHHPQVGQLDLDWDAYPLPGGPGPVLVVYTAVPGSDADDRLRLLSTLLATPTTEAGAPAVEPARARPA